MVDKQKDKEKSVKRNKLYYKKTKINRLNVMKTALIVNIVFVYCKIWKKRGY